MRKVIFDIESSNIFSDVGSTDPAALDLALVCIHDSETDTYSSYTQTELKNLWPILERTDLLIGYNSDHFDIPLLNKYYPGDLTHLRSLDLMKEIRSASGRWLRLTNLTEATLGLEKSGEGIEATVWWKNGEYDKVRDYCIQDVKITKALYEHALAHHEVKYRYGSELITVQLDTAHWNGKTDTSMTHTLGF